MGGRYPLVRAGLAAAVFCLIAACTTAPPTPASPRAAAAAPMAAEAARATLPDPGGDPSLGTPFFSLTPELLAGEMPRELQRGSASWYGPRFHGRRTANGERYDMHGFTAAHRTLPFGTIVRVRGLRTGREVEVRINDRGPFAPGRVIDLSRAAADSLGMLGLGVKEVMLLVPESTPGMAPSAASPAKASTRAPWR